jgi:hypothetical protein
MSLRQQAFQSAWRVLSAALAGRKQARRAIAVSRCLKGACPVRKGASGNRTGVGPPTGWPRAAGHSARSRSLFALASRDKQPAEDCSNEPAERSAIDACVDIALQGGGGVLVIFDRRPEPGDPELRARFEPAETPSERKVTLLKA